MLKPILNLFFPEVCYACSHILSDNEKHICTSCRHDLPVTNYHFNHSDVVKNIFYGRLQLEFATALFQFQKKGIVQHLLHNLKYKGHETISDVLGNWLGHELKGVTGYNSIDIVIPVPLHKNKLKQRGYNQVTKFGLQIAKALNAEYLDDVLVKISATKTQVFKSRISRLDTTKTLFTVKNEHLIKNKHVLLVDDIITTGATIEACAIVLNQATTLKISVATMAIAL